MEFPLIVTCLRCCIGSLFEISLICSFVRKPETIFAWSLLSVYLDNRHCFGLVPLRTGVTRSYTRLPVPPSWLNTIRRDTVPGLSFVPLSTFDSRSSQVASARPESATPVYSTLSTAASQVPRAGGEFPRMPRSGRTWSLLDLPSELER